MTVRPCRVALVVTAIATLTLAGCGRDGRATDEGPRRGLQCSGLALASMSALTGSESGLGRAVSRGAELAVAEFVARHPDCEVRLEQIDTEGLPPLATTAAEEIADDAAVIGIVGPAFSGETAAAGPALDDAGLAIVTPSATNPTLSTKGWAGFHRIVAADDTLGAATAAFVAGRSDGGPFAVIDDGSAYGGGLADVIEARLGDRVKVSRTVATGADDAATVVSAIVAADARTVFYAGYVEDSAAFARALRAGGSDAQLIVSEGAYNPRFLRDAGSAGDGVLVVTSTAPESTVPDFAAAYRARFGASPPAFAAEAYDAANALLAAIADGARTRSEVIAFLADADLDGITRPLRWTPTGEPAAAAFRLVKAADGSFIDQGPVPAAR